MTQEELILKYAELKKENEQLKAENELLREKIFDELHVDHEMIEAENKRLTDLLYEQSKNLDSLNLEVERLKDVIVKVKDTCSVSPSVIFPSDIVDTINEYLEEVGE